MNTVCDDCGLPYESAQEAIDCCRKPRIGSLFSGYGGLDLAAEAFFDATTAWHVEFDKAPSKILEARWPGVPNYGDITAVDWAQVEPVDILTGGFPCQDLSLAGRRQGMRPGTRSGLWADFVKAIDVLNPAVVVIENVRGLLSGCAESDLGLCEGCVGDREHRPVLRALGRVLGDLADLGFDAEWSGIRASDVGAPHGRFRVFVVAYRRDAGHAGWDVAGSVGDLGTGAVPVTALFRAPAAAEAEGGRRNPDREVATMRLSDQVLEEQGRGILLPTPAAMNPNDEEDLDNWLERRARVKESKQNGNGFGTPLGVAVRLLPSPRASEGEKGGPNMRGSKGDLMLSSAVTQQAIEWGQYAPAVHRWEAITRAAPAPTLADGRDGNHRLNAAFAEWMMGLPAGWVTDVGLSRREALKACGNGVVPQQAYAALEGMWSRVAESVPA